MGACNGKSEPSIATQPNEPEILAADKLEKNIILDEDIISSFNENEEDLVCRHYGIQDRIPLSRKPLNVFPFKARYCLFLLNVHQTAITLTCILLGCKMDSIHSV